MSRLTNLLASTAILVVSCSLVGSCTKEAGQQPHPSASPTSGQPEDEQLLPLSEEVKRDLKVVRGANLLVLTMPMPAGRAGVDLGNLELSTLPSGCVILRQRSGPKDHWPVIWPEGTSIGADGTISAQFETNPNGKFQIGQTVTGGDIGKWTAKMMKPPKEVTDVCPADRYLRVDDLEQVER